MTFVSLTDIFIRQGPQHLSGILLHPDLRSLPPCLTLFVSSPMVFNRINSVFMKISVRSILLASSAYVDQGCPKASDTKRVADLSRPASASSFAASIPYIRSPALDQQMLRPGGILHQDAMERFAVCPKLLSYVDTLTCITGSHS